MLTDDMEEKAKQTIQALTVTTEQKVLTSLPSDWPRMSTPWLRARAFANIAAASPR